VGKFLDGFIAISTPDTPRYGQFYEGHEIRSLLKPTDEASNTVTRWLKQNGISSVKDDGDYVLFHTDVETANRLLDTRFNWYRHLDTGQELLRTQSLV